MTRHLRVDGPTHDDRLDHMAQGILGQPLNRLEGPLKVTGRAAYADHYPFDAGDLRDLLAEAERLRAIPVTTRKDFVRLPPAFRARVTVLNIALRWEEPLAIESLLDPLAQRVPVPA